MPALNLRELHEQGFTVLPAMVPADLCRRARAAMDEIIGPVGEAADSSRGRVYDGEPAGLLGRFADAAHEGLRTGRPVVTSADYRHGIRHPISDPVLAELAVAGGMLDVQRQALRGGGDDGAPVDLKLMQQLLVRSDPSEGLGAQGLAPITDPDKATTVKFVADRWHYDYTFAPDWYDDARRAIVAPRRMYFHTLTALSTVESGGGAFTVGASCATPWASGPV